jgi:hypothetical protein
MENKYYTPEIEEFHVGFEYEIKEYGELFLKEKYKLDGSYKNVESDLMPLLFDGDIRVKYLDKEDIESLGWKHIGSLWFKHTFGYKLRKWKGQSLDIFEESMIDTEDDLLIFRGDIKNKSELKKLMSQLGIK